MITFIIPTIGRNTLKYAIQSIENQTDDDWKIIIVFDGIKPTIDVTNPKIKILETTKRGKDKNSAGNVRNYGMRHVDTEWIAFLDDDDIISNDYVETFKKELHKYSFIDVLIFRMYRKNQNDILPRLQTDNFYEGEVGISFVLKTEIFKSGLQFIPSSTEDYDYLNRMRERKYIIMISPYVTYFVNSSETMHNNTLGTGNRIILNNITESFSQLDNYNTLYSLNIIPLLLSSILGLFLLFRRSKKKIF